MIAAERGFMPPVKISSRFQIRVPKELREKLGLRPRQTVYVFERDGQLRVALKAIQELRGMAKGMKWKDDYRDHTERF